MCVSILLIASLNVADLPDAPYLSIGRFKTITKLNQKLNQKNYKMQNNINL